MTKTVRFSKDFKTIEAEIPQELYDKIVKIYQGIELGIDDIRHGNYSDAEIDLKSLLDNKIEAV